MAVADWVIQVLESSGIIFDARHHPDVFTSHQVAEKENVPPNEVAKVVVVFIQDKPVGLVLPANRRVDLEAVADIAHTNKVRLASEAEIETLFPDCEVGAIPPLNHWEGIRFWMDSHMETNSGEMLIQGGTHSDALILRYDDWFRLVRPRVERFTTSRDAIRLGLDEEEERYKGEHWPKLA